MSVVEPCAPKAIVCMRRITVTKGQIMEELTKTWENNTKEVWHLLQTQHLKMLSIQSRDSTRGCPRIYILIFPLLVELVDDSLFPPSCYRLPWETPCLCLKVSGILVITGRSVTQIKGVIFHCNTAQIQDKLGPTERSSQNGSLNHNTILHLDLFCRRQGKWCEIPYVQDVVVIYQDSSIYQRIRECPKRRELQTWPWYCEWYIPEWSVSPRKGPTIRPSCFIIPKL